MITVLFAVLYKIVPDVTLRWSDVALGAALTALLFMIGKQLMALYFAYADLRSTYGVAGSPIVVLLWVYYSAQLFFWGAEFSKVYTRTLRTHKPADATSQAQPPFVVRHPRRPRASGEDASNSAD
jgi:membrane protein